MKKRIYSILLLLFFTIISSSIYAQMGKNINPAFMKYHYVGSELPQLKIKTSDSKIITNKDLKPEHYLFLILFNPQCPHCIKMGKLISKNTDLFKNVIVVFMTQKNQASGLDFYEKALGLSQYPNFIVGTDESNATIKIDNYTELPQINVYDKDKKLISTFNGNTELSSLKKYLP